MTGSNQIPNVPALILAGGLGSRLKKLTSDKPKPMVEIHGRPFLYWLCLDLHHQGFREFYISTGYLHEKIESYPWLKDFPDSKFFFSMEDTPLGTGGAVIHLLKTYPYLTRFWIINGDTLLSSPLQKEKKKSFKAYYTTQNPSQVFDATPNLWIQDDYITKLAPDGQLFDAGSVYIDNVAVFSKAMTKSPPFALSDALQTAMNEKSVGFFATKGTCYDIGTPERLERFKNYVKQHFLK